MRFQTPLVSGRLIRRYKRFLADVTLEDGREVTAHCPNPGSMMGLAEPGMKIWLEPNEDPRKKLKFGWRLVDHQNGHFTGVDTSVPNRALRAALEGGQIAELARYKTIRPEVKYGKNSRIDFLLTQPGLPDAYVEIKSVTLSRTAGSAEFPDCVTARGTKHLQELIEMKRKGARAVLLFLVQRTDCQQVHVAADIDPKYAHTFDAARAAGVEVIAYGTHISPDNVTIAGPMPVDSAPQSHL